MTRKSTPVVLLSVVLLLALLVTAVLPRPASADSGELTHASRYPDGVVAEGDEAAERLARNPELKQADAFRVAILTEQDPLAVNPELRFASGRLSDQERDPLAVNPELRFVRGSSEAVVADR